MSSNATFRVEETNANKPLDDHEFEDALSLCDLPMCNKDDDYIDENYQYFSKEEEDLFEFLASDINSSRPDEHIIFCGKLIASEGERKLQGEAKKRMAKNDSIVNSSSKRNTKLLLILLGIPPKTQTEMELMNDIRNRQSRHAPSTFFPSDSGVDKKVHDHHPKAMKGFWKLINVASCFGGQFMQSPAL